MSAFPRILLCFPFACLFLSSCETTPPAPAAAPGAAAAGAAAPENTTAEPAEVIAAYPLEICLVSDEPLGSRNDERVLFHAGQEVKVCSKDCLTSFRSNPDKYLAKLP